MHPLERLLNPKCIALIGASAKPGSIGNNTLRFLRRGGYQGAIYPVNPRYTRIDGERCYESLAELPQVADLAIVALGGKSVEQALEDAIAVGVGGIVMYANNYVADDDVPPLLERLRTKAAQAGIPVCGGNAMGFQNHDAGIVASFDRAFDPHPGQVTLIAHSGSVMTYLANNDPRFTYNLVVSNGQEINATFVDYMDYALEQPSTKAVALFIETVRDPKGFERVLNKARGKDIPVVVAKVGRTEKSARFAKSHSGALAGDDQAFQAVCNRYGAVRVRDLDELGNTAYLLARVDVVPEGGLTSITDSGGLREQFIDLADEIGVTFTALSAATKDRLAEHLEYGLQPDNPLDAMGALNADVGSTFGSCLSALADDAGTALLGVEFEFRDDLCHYPALFDVVKRASKRTDKPLVVINSFTRASNTHKAIELSHAGIPVINGADIALKAIKHVLRYRDFKNRKWAQPAPPKPDTVRLWQQRLAEHSEIDEHMALSMLADFDLPIVHHTVTDALGPTLQAADRMGYPVVLKSAQPGLMHKTDVGGVCLNLQDRLQVEAAYLQLSERLDNRVLVAPMVMGGVELAFGMVRDDQFGPVVMVGAGGIHVELLEDHQFALAPFCDDEAMAMIEATKIARLMRGARNREPCDLHQLARALSRFSIMAFSLKDHLHQMDINPIIAHPEGCTVVDALAVPHPLAN